MKTYVVYCIKGYDYEKNGDKYHPIKAMIGKLEKTGSTYKVRDISLVKCTAEFTCELNKPCNLYFDEYGRATMASYING